MLLIGCDVSNWTAVPTAAQAAELAGYGLGFAFVGTSYWQQQPDGSYRYVGEEQCVAFEAAGWPTGEYQFPYRLHSTRREWYGDVEEPNVTLDAIRNFLRQGAAGPYTRLGIAQGYDWDCVAEFPGAKLWDARYISHHNGLCLIAEAVAGGGDVAHAIQLELAQLSPFVPYWGFTRAEVTQWHDTVVIAGVSMDLNVREQEDSEMKSFNAWAYEAGRHYFVGPDGPKYITDQATADELTKLFGPIAVALSNAALHALGG